MKKYLLVFAFILLTPLLGDRVYAQWVAIDAPWGGGLSAEIVANDSNVFLSNAIDLYSSSDNGQNWEEIGSGIEHPNYPFIAGSSLFVVGGDSNYVYRSFDMGMSWDSGCSGLPAGAISDLVGNALNLFGCGGYVYPGAVFHSTDSGATWTKGVNGLPAGAWPAVLEVIDTNVLVGTSSFDGAYLSTDSGTTWSPVNGGFPANSWVFSFASIGRIVLAGLVIKGQDHGDVFRSTDNGQSWVLNDSGLSASDTIFDFAISGSRIFAALDDGGVYYSSDSGQSWNRADWWPLANPLTQSIAATDISVFAGTYLEGLWRRPLSDFGIASVNISSLPSNSTSLEAYPDPITSTTTISFTLPEASQVMLTLTDAAGREWPLMPAQYLSSGQHEVPWDASNYPSGVYLCRLEAAGESVTRRVVVIK